MEGHSCCRWLAPFWGEKGAECVSLPCQYIASPSPRLLQCLLVATHGNWASCDPRLNCRGSRSSSGPQRHGVQAHRRVDTPWRHEISDSRKTAVINNELLRLQVDIAAVQETRLLGSGTLRERDFTFFWQGKGPEEIREHGVGFAVRSTLIGMTEPCERGTERILTLRLHTTDGPVNLVSAYAPTLYSSQEAKDEFYDQLQTVIQGIPSRELLLLLGDVNARVGADRDSWPTCLGRRDHLRNVLTTRSYQSADCDTDHSLVCCKIRLQPKKMHQAKPLGKPRIDVIKTSHPKRVESFTKSPEEALFTDPPEGDAQQRWSQLRQIIYNSALQAFGKKQKKTQDWFEANSSELNPVIEEKHAALLEHKRNPSQATQQALKSARSKVQKRARRCANDYWLQLCKDIQTSADTGNIRGVYDGIKRAMGPTQTKVAPLKSSTGEVIKDKAKQMDRWVEHYSELYSRENIVSDDAFDAIDSLPCMMELDVPPTVMELRKAIDNLPTGKAPGLDGIPPEAIKCAKGVLLSHLFELLCQCWTEGQVPQDMRDSNIVTLYKNKGDRSDCNNYRGISLLNIVGKVYARVILNRLQKLADRVYPESQCGFRSRRSTIDMVFSLRQLQERCREQRQPLYIAFIDLTKAFDLVSRDGLFRILAKIGCPPKLLSVIQAFHTDMKGVVQFDGASSKAFSICNGVKQGCVLAPTLFGIFFAVMLKHAFGSSTEGVYLHTRSDGRLFNLSRLKAKTKVRKAVIRDMLFADDAALATHTEQQLQSLMDSFSCACLDFGMNISIKKTEVLGQGVEQPPVISANNSKLEVVHEFTYLGSTVSDDLSLDIEINRRIGRAASTFARLTERVWENGKLTIHTKTAVYRTCVLSTLLYGSESWALYSRQEKRLNTFHLRNLRRILGIKWSDHVTNTEVLAQAGIQSLVTLLQQRRLRWLGHVYRMPEGRIPKVLLYGELASGKISIS
ncbi:uncharacterized protein LOC119736778 [Patiria miniata]|uniref:Reverse transcriptase domain-containing protein n=1 Tax=Patiria miniata TaxID=46514 RepID=A0A914ARN6_PATMI|nr:uncharacterized protein LOC119736778 [Patiria miniata]